MLQALRRQKTCPKPSVSPAELIERLLLVWLILLSLLAFYCGRWLPAGWDPFIASYPARNGIFALAMLAIGSLLPREEVRAVFRRWPVVLGGTAVQYTAMPLLAWSVGQLFGLKGGWWIGLVVVGCVPGAMASNVLTLAARGNVSYSVSLTTSATLLSPLVVPFALWVSLGRWARVDPWEQSWYLCYTVVLPVVAGYLLSQYARFWHTAARRLAAPVANLTILWIIAMVVAVNRQHLACFEARVLGALLALNLAGYLAGAAGAWLMRLPVGMRRALTLEVGMQNAGLGTLLAMKFFAESPEAAIPPAIYTFGCMLTGTILARLWAELGPAPPADAAAG